MEKQKKKGLNVDKFVDNLEEDEPIVEEEEEISDNSQEMMTMMNQMIKGQLTINKRLGDLENKKKVVPKVIQKMIEEAPEIEEQEENLDDTFRPKQVPKNVVPRYDDRVPKNSSILGNEYDVEQAAHIEINHKPIVRQRQPVTNPYMQTREPRLPPMNQDKPIVVKVPFWLTAIMILLLVIVFLFMLFTYLSPTSVCKVLNITG